jgi:hypothetical protein
MARSPLFDIYDPYGELEERARLGMLDDEDYLAGPVSLRKPTLSDLMPEEEKSGWLNTLAEMGSSGLATAGYLLDTPGALVRGILAGDPLSVFGSSEDRVTGRELLRQYGMVGEEDNWSNFSGGLAAEVLLDPLTYATGGLSLLGKGAASQAQKAARAAGLLRNDALDSVARVNPLRQRAGLPAYDDAIPTPRVREYLRRETPQGLIDALPAADQAAALRRLRQQMERFGVTDMNAPLGVLENVRIPGTNIGFEIQGGAIGDALAQGFDRFGDITKRAPVIGTATRTAAAMFDPAVGDLATVRSDLDLTNELQLEKRFAAAGKRDAQERIRRARTLLQYDARNAQVPEVIPSGPLAGTAVPAELRTFDSQSLSNALQDYVEAPQLQGPTLTGGLIPKTTGNEVADWVLENIPEFRAVRDHYAQLGPRARVGAQRAGLEAPVAASRGSDGWLPRQLRFFDRPSPPDIPGGRPYRERGWGRDERAFGVRDNFGRQRDPAYDLPGGARAFRYLTGGQDNVIDPAALRDALINAPTGANLQQYGPMSARGLRQRIVQDALDQLGAYDPVAFTRGGTARPYDYLLDNLRNSRRFQQATPARQQALLARTQRQVDANYDKLANLILNADTQFAEQGVGIFDSPAWNNTLRYEMGQATNTANADRLFAMLGRRAENLPAGSAQAGVSISLADAARELGFSPANFRRRWQQDMGADVTNFSINRNIVDAMKTLSPQTRLAPAEGALRQGVDQFTNAFKIGALASPAFHVRNAYSGGYNAGTQGAFNPLDYWAAFRASQGNYDALRRRLPRGRGQLYEGLTEDEALRQFLADGGAQRISSGNVLADVTATSSPTEVQGLYTGASNEPTMGQAARELLTGRSGRTWRQFGSDFFSLRGVGITDQAPRRNTNPALVLNDAVGQGVEDMLRTGTFLNQIRKGADPTFAGDLTRLTQLDYAPEAYTSFERNFMKRLMPFYSFQRQILPSIADNVMYRPGGLQGQTIRAVTRGTEPSEDNFIPEYLRQSAAIPLPEGWPSLLGGEPAEGLQRYITNIDLPFESTLNLFTPGVGTTAAARFADTVQKSGSNILGQANPLIKAPLEYITNRQLYTGRDMSDLYSVLEQDLGPIGRPLEQAIINFVPFGARGISMYRQLTDDRLDPVDARMKAAFNVLAGVKLTDVDEERTKRQAARGMLNQILETTPGVRTYENITVPDDALRSMPEDQRQMYLLYRILQSDAAKRARERKKTALDPLEVLGAVR